MRVGIADHLGWAIAVTSDAEHAVVDRRRISLVAPGLSAAPIHYDRGRLDDAGEDIAVQRRAPYEARADAIMYRQLLAELAHERGWEVHCYDAKRVEAQAAALLGDRADEILRGPRSAHGPPWTKDHRVALAATVLASVRPAERPVAR